MMLEMERKDFPAEHCTKCLIDQGVSLLFKSPFSPSRGWLECMRSVLRHKRTRENLEAAEVLPFLVASSALKISRD
ncbi:hypothetical protein L484_023306 [Morus notabilis]|uniref:Uncharacterized protein n=1 Tax=Morus notabilis TaxID=981085 RepID=W9RNL5_9ROSA|nr:hypothetical protein L484_023306 [Morus notabilis]